MYQGAVSTLLSLGLVKMLGFKVESFPKKIIVGSNTTFTTLGIAKAVMNSIETLSVTLNFIKIINAYYDVFVELQAIKILQACIGLGTKAVRMKLGKNNARIPLSFDFNNYTQYCLN